VSEVDDVIQRVLDPDELGTLVGYLDRIRAYLNRSER
jgi:hypothetical protein